MPYTTSTSDGKVTVFKKIGKRKKVVGHTTPQKKKRYLKALRIHSKDKDMKKENFEFDNQIGDVYAVTKPWDGCQTSAMVHKVDPMMGIQNIEPQQVYGLYPDEDSAMTIAERLYGDHMKTAQMLEKKKQAVIKKIKEAIDQLEAKRAKSVNLIKENPKNASKHKNEIASLASQIDDLMVKLERVEKSKKEEEKEEKEDLKENELKLGVKYDGAFNLGMGKGHHIDENKNLKEQVANEIDSISEFQQYLRDFAKNLPNIKGIDVNEVKKTVELLQTISGNLSKGSIANTIDMANKLINQKTKSISNKNK